MHGRIYNYIGEGIVEKTVVQRGEGSDCLKAEPTPELFPFRSRWGIHYTGVVPWNAQPCCSLQMCLGANCRVGGDGTIEQGTNRAQGPETQQDRPRFFLDPEPIPGPSATKGSCARSWVPLLGQSTTYSCS